MPVRSIRSVSRGVQDAQEVKAKKFLEQERKKEKRLRWCAMIGMTLAEFILCIICFSLGYAYYHSVIAYRNDYAIKHKSRLFRYILLPPAPLAIASVFLTLTYIDLISWHNVRPIPYFGWIMVTTGGFLLFLLYAGVILLSCSTIVAIVAIVFGILTAIVFLVDLVFMLLSMNRFPAPYYVLKRKYEKMDECVCTGDYDPEEDDHVERPICRCGDHWGEPCTCDDPDTTCGCGAKKKGSEPCECCECPDEEEEDYEDIKSIVSTSTGRDYAEERRKSMLTQVDVDDLGSGYMSYSQRRPQLYCIDGSKHSFKPEFYRSIAAQSQDERSIHSAQPHDGTSTYSSQHQGRMSTYSTSNRSALASLKAKSPSKISHKSIQRPSISQAAQIGGLNEDLTEALGTPNTALASKLALHKPQKHHPKKSHLSYSVHATKLEDQKSVEQSFASKYERKKSGPSHPTKSLFKRIRYGDKTGPFKGSTSEDEIGEGDFSRTASAFPEEPLIAYSSAYPPGMDFPTYKPGYRLDPEIGYLSDPETTNGPTRDYTLPGQTSSMDDGKTYTKKKNVSVSARERESGSTLRTPSTICSDDEHMRSRSSVTNLGSPRIIRNVATTVRAVRTLSKVMEADNESRSVSQSDRDIRDSEEYPSENTISIKK